MALNKNNKYISWIVCLAYGTTLFRFGCLWKRILGIPCMGCGFTRAMLCMIRLDLRGAWHYHPMYWSIFVFALFFRNKGKPFKNNEVNIYILIVIFFLFWVTWIVRLISGCADYL